jgi:hypothetical protein
MPCEFYPTVKYVIGGISNGLQQEVAKNSSLHIIVMSNYLRIISTPVWTFSD